MASCSRVQLSDSDLSSPSVGARSEPMVAAGEGAQPWQSGGKRSRRKEMLQRRREQVLPTWNPPAHKFIPPGMVGLCYNCLGEDHISRGCKNKVRCLNCREEGHKARGCKRPRPQSSPEEAEGYREPPRRSRSPTWLPPPPPGPPPAGAARILVDVLPPPPAGPPPAGAVRLGRPWNRDGREGSVESSARGPVFNAPFDGNQAPAAPQLAARQRAFVEEAGPLGEACFLEYSEEMGIMEEELRKAVLVTITGTRPEVDLADAALALHAEFGVGPDDMSIRAFAPEDFLVLCKEGRLRDSMARRGMADGPFFSLALKPWIRQAQATAASLHYLVALDLLGVPAHAWSRRTAETVLKGTGFVVDVAAPTARRHDMSYFRVWVRTDSPERIPTRKLLFVEEPPVERRPMGRHRGPMMRRRAKTLTYPIRIRRVREPVLAEVSDSPPPPTPPPPPSPPSGGWSQEGGGSSHAAPSRRVDRSLSGAASSAGASATGEEPMEEQLEEGELSGCGCSSEQPTAGGQTLSPPVSGMEFFSVQISNSEPAAVGDVESSPTLSLQSGSDRPELQRQRQIIFGSFESVVGRGTVAGADGQERTVSSAASAAGGQLVGHLVDMCGQGEPSPLSVMGPCRQAAGGGEDSVVASSREGYARDSAWGQAPVANGEQPLLLADQEGDRGLETDQALLQDQAGPSDVGIRHGPDMLLGPLAASQEDPRVGEVAAGAATPPASLRSISAPVSPTNGFVTPARDGDIGANIRAVISQLRQHVEAPVLPLPEVQRGRRRKLFVAEEDRRRSARIAALAPGNTTTYIKKAQKVLMSRLGICDIEGEEPIDCLAKYADYFREPMHAQRVEAVANLFFLNATLEPVELGF